MNRIPKIAILLPGVLIFLLIALLNSCAAPAAPIVTPTTGQTAISEPTPVPTSTPTPTVLPSSTPPPPSPTSTSSPTPTPLRFAVIGDYGSNEQPEADVAALVKSWDPALIITTGDNNYPSGAAETIDLNIGQYYQEFIYPYDGEFGEGADTNRFFPSLGNHDYMTNQAAPYFDYFTLPGNERYYDFVWGPVHFFAINSNSQEPDGFRADSAQAQWLRETMTASQSPWQVVYMHVPPYSSGLHGSATYMRWPFAEWGADAVITGHDHTYERLQVDGIPYFVNGVGGGAIYYFEEIDPASQFRYADDHGAMLVTASESWMQFEFISRQGQVIDSWEIEIPPDGT